MTYQETIDFLFQMLPMYQKVGKTAYKKDLGNTLKLLEALDNPHKKFKSIHIAGTNGKGSSAHCIAAILQLAGYKTGLYTSPHLISFTERIKINGQEIAEKDVIEFVELIKPQIHSIKPSFFEVTVAMSFYYFAKNKVDIAVVETGLGGRLDSTNVISPEVCLITNIGLDHTHILGDSRKKIAYEKAGIIKENIPVIIGEFDEEILPVFQQKTKEQSAELILTKAYNYTDFDEFTPNYFKRNVNGILAVIEQLNKMKYDISEKIIFEGIKNFTKITGLKGRFQILSESPLMIADISHNEDGLKILLNQVQQINQGKLHIIYGTVADKAVEKILDLFPSSNTNFYWTQSKVPRALPVTELQKLTESKNLYGAYYENVNDAINYLKKIAHSNDTILITGSTFLVSEIADL